MTMPALILTVLNIGRAALVNAAHNGTLPVTIAKCGVTATAFVPDKTMVALPGETKRIDTLAGGATAADTLHVTVRDASTDTYSVRGLCLYLADGTPFAVYGQAAVIVEKSAQATMLLASDVQFADIDATSLVFGDANFLLNAATTELQGVMEIATDDETITGTDAVRAVPPKGLRAALNARFGIGAPSGFVKGLLTAATALAFRTTLAIKGAALKDEGHGNGLDADTLDGKHGTYYLDYGHLQNIPGDFHPSTHQHSTDDITSGTLPVPHGGTGLAELTAGSYLIGNGTNAVALKTPAQVLSDIGAAPSAHSHSWSAINDPPEMAIRWPVVAEVTGLADALIKKADTRPSPSFVVGSPGAGYVRLNQSVGAGVAGWVGFYASDDQRRGYIGNTHDGVLEISGEGARIAISGHVVTDSTLRVAGNLIQTITGGAGNEGQWVPTPSADYYFFANASNAGLYSSSAGYAWGWNYASRTLTVAGLTISRGGFDSSDARLKYAIERIAPRPLHRSVHLHAWRWLIDDAAGIGGIAQQVQESAPEHVTSHDTPDGERLAIDKAGLAFEQSLWAGEAIDKLHATIHALTARLDALESRA